MSDKKKIRKEFRDACLTRDKFCCKVCGKKGKDRQGGELHLKFHSKSQNLIDLDCHHIQNRNDIPNGGYIKENGISLCTDCHINAELYHISEGKEFVPGFHPNDLFILIGSSLEKAINFSKKIK
mgnify:CR=1 FL=1|jgi:hypothetical protein